jgi:hypothetical protein
MSHSKRAPAGLEELTILMNEIAPEFVTMNTDDPRRASLLKQFEQLAEIRMSIRSNLSELIGQRMDELSREMITLGTGEARRAQIVNEMESLRELLRIVNG